jgi:hypothetical protein
MPEVEVSVRASDEPMCERCWRRDGECAYHDYWPTWFICKRCVGHLLEMKVKPFVNILGDWIMFDNEMDWWKFVERMKP